MACTCPLRRLSTRGSHFSRINNPFRSSLNNRRPFSVSSVESPNTLTETVLNGPLQFLDLIHATGLPWFAAIPVAAVCVRGVLVYYLVKKPEQAKLSRRYPLYPLIGSRFTYHLNSRTFSMNQRRAATPIPAITLAFWRQWDFYRLSKTYNLPTFFHWTTFVNFPLLLCFAGAVRTKCGISGGLISLIVTPFENAYQRAATMFRKSPDETQDPTAVPYTVSKESEAMDSVGDPQSGGSYIADPSMSLEGIPGWCPDLTIPDPTLLLPITFGALITLSVLLPRTFTRSQSNSSMQERLKLNWFQKAELSLMLLLITVATQLPAGVVLYLSASYATGLAQRQYLSRKNPLPPPITGCRIPLRVKTRKEWSD